MRPLGTPSPTLGELNATLVGREGILQCLQPPPAAFRSGVNTNGASIDFSGTMFLGVPNPLEFQVNAEWQLGQSKI